MTRPKSKRPNLFKNQKSSPIASKNLPQSDDLWIDSWSALQEYLAESPRLVKKIEVLPKEQNRLKSLLEGYEFQGKIEINSELPVALRAQVEIDEFNEDEMIAELKKVEGKSIVVVLDQITDTRNLGAIARSAAFFGVRWIMMPKDRQASITGATLSTAQGAFALIRSVRVTNLSRSMKKLKEIGYWILGADMDGEPIAAVAAEYQKVVLVLGREDHGLRSLTRKNCDRFIAIPGAEQRVESLNVSVAAGICLYQLTTESFSK